MTNEQIVSDVKGLSAECEKRQEYAIKFFKMFHETPKDYKVVRGENWRAFDRTKHIYLGETHAKNGRKGHVAFLAKKD